MSSVRGHVCSAAAPRRNSPVGGAGAQHGSSRAVAEKCRGDHIGFRATVDPARQRAQLHHDHENDLARFGPREPCTKRQSGHTAGASATEHRHAQRGRPKAHLRRDARLDARCRNACRGHRDDHIDVTRGDTRLIKRGARRLREQFARALEIDVGAFGEVVRLAEPLERAHGVAPIDSDIDENIGEFRIARERAHIGVPRRRGDGRLLKLVRRHRSRNRKQIHRLHHINFPLCEKGYP